MMPAGSGARSCARARMSSNVAACTSSGQRSSGTVTSRRRPAAASRPPSRTRGRRSARARCWARAGGTTRRSRARRRRAASPGTRGGRRPSRSSPAATPQGRPGSGWLARRRRAGQLAHALPVQVGALVVERDGHVEGMAGDDDVGRPGIDDHAVEGGVRLEEPPVVLRGQAGEELVLRLDQPVQPRGQLTEGRGQVGRLEDQQGADHLHPRRAALGPGADDDVAGPEGELGPAPAVLVGRPVAERGHGPRH